ncbi:nucleotidyltransferase [Aeromonas phage ST21]|uniref:Nucleotidyltransferase n=1 Tax=Aeromonas phage ST21 TaxID=3065691 RepID=A0AA96J427_9CAUD|nr:nucleotidyltransferase [Aeromonas phage ST21]
MQIKHKPILTEQLRRKLLSCGSVCAILESETGKVARLVGGAVRDLYRDVEPHDFDIAVIGLHDETDGDMFQIMSNLCGTFSDFGYKTEVHQAYQQASRDFNARWSGVIKLESPLGMKYDILLSRNDSLAGMLEGFDCEFNQCFMAHYDNASECAELHFVGAPNYEYQKQLKPVRYERRQRLEEIARNLGYKLMWPTSMNPLIDSAPVEVKFESPSC